FDHVISVEEAGNFKPHWKTYAKAAEIIGEDPPSILFVANHAFDCIGAKSYGMRTAFIDRRKRPFGQTPHQPHLVVADFAELAAAWVGRLSGPLALAGVHRHGGAMPIAAGEPRDLGVVRHDGTRAEVRALFELPFPKLIFRAQRIHRLHFDPAE